MMNKSELPPEIEELSHRIIGCAIEVHRQLGPGLLEKLYEDALVYELREAGLTVAQQVDIAIPYKSTVLRGQRLDVLVEDQIIVELKSIAQITDINKAQLLSQLRAAQLPLGLLINFNVTVLKTGLSRILNERAIPATASRSSRPSRSMD
ncbi:MAG: GxxExxY protein [Phycisphaerales bacterium]|nr:GxxExxY protein [Phycisphaerales bacterium]